MQSLSLNGVSKLLSSRNKTRTSAVVFVALLMFSAVVAVLPAAFAQVIAVPDRPTGTFVGVSPKLVGLGQEVIINIITYPAPQGPTFWVSDLVGVFPSGFMNTTVSFTKPDGTKDTFMPIDETLEHIGVKVPGAQQIVGSLQFRYKPDQVGNYSVSASFPGQTYTNEKVHKTFNQTVYYKPSSSKTYTFTVQEDLVLAGLLNGWPWSPLPTAYWKNPVQTDNREWAATSGDWVTGGYDLVSTRYNVYSTAPNSPHILWTNVVGTGGLPGGIWGSLPYGGQGAPMGGAGGIILDGVIYQASVRNSSEFECVDLLTGEVLWSRSGSPSRAQRLDLAFQTEAQVNEGGISTHLWQFSSSSWVRYNPYNGEVLQTITNVPTDVTTPAFEDGDPVTYLAQRGGFNTTIPMNWAYEYLIKWDYRKLQTTAGITVTTSNDWRKGIVWNVSIRQPGGTELSISAVSGNPSLNVNIWPAANVVTVRSANTYRGFDMTTGAYLWDGTTVVSMAGGGSGGPTGPENYGPQMIFDGATCEWVAYDMRTGKKMWATQVGQLPWGDLPSFLYVFHNGNVYVGSYDGHVYALDLDDGHIVWTSDYVGAEDESIYGHQPFNGAAVGAGGKLYFSTSTTYSLMPRTRFHELVCIDEATGHFLWTLPIGISPTAIADGYLLGRDSENGLQYCIGKGQTATTVSIQNDVITAGSSALIKGTVMDMSLAQPDTPAVSDADMSEWMDYLHGQNATLLNSPPTPKGVDVSLVAVGPNGNVVDIGTVTSDESGMFKKMWKPEVEGGYTIYATFAGSDSYWSSYAETALGVEAAPETGNNQPQTIVPDNAPMFIASTAAIIIAIAIAAILLLRKGKPQ